MEIGGPRLKMRVYFGIKMGSEALIWNDTGHVQACMNSTHKQYQSLFSPLLIKPQRPTKAT
jgi:hypothetical protein